jgi:hypothetical protein
VFPATRRYVEPATGEQRRHHIHETALQRAVRTAARSAQTASSSLPKFFVDLVGHNKSSLADELREECRVIPRTRPHVHDRRPWKDPTSLEAARVQTR